jgi:hypothetical protein
VRNSRAIGASFVGSAAATVTNAVRNVETINSMSD